MCRSPDGSAYNAQDHGDVSFKNEMIRLKTEFIFGRKHSILFFIFYMRGRMWKKVKVVSLIENAVQLPIF